MADIDQFIETIVEHIAVELNSSGSEWESFAIVFECDDDSSVGNYGYFYWTGGRKPFAIDETELDRTVLAFRNALRDNSGAGWVKTLIQYVRAGRKLNIEYEFDDPDRWSVTPKNAEATIKALQPH